MSKSLILEQLHKSGADRLGILQTGDVFIGREPEGSGIIIDAVGVSRTHGVFSRIRDHWFYRDLGSTNGSWINGTQVRANDWNLLRPGVHIQIADVILRLKDGNESNRNQDAGGAASIGGRSLMVFNNGEFVDEYPIPEYGRALVVGGSKADLQLEGDIFEEPSLVVERQGDGIFAYSMLKEAQISHNDQALKEKLRMADGDVLRIGSYVILFNDALNSAQGADVSGQADAWTGKHAGNAHVAALHRRQSSTFGQLMDGAAGDHDINETIAMDMAGAEMHPSMRYTQREGMFDGARSWEDRLIILLGIVLFVILMGSVIWWFFM